MITLARIAVYFLLIIAIPSYIAIKLIQRGRNRYLDMREWRK